MVNFINVLAALSTTPTLVRQLNEILDTEISLPNIPTPTMGGQLVWDTLAESNGWRLQQNELTKHCRILDPDDVRRAWGTRKGMLKALETLQNSLPHETTEQNPA
ncbi:MAG: hypothetical protein IJR72_02700 [Oscillospiraceae bacterium]|nr:hypothetical protein [Oscillospiraceae bacterium]